MHTHESGTRSRGGGGLKDIPGNSINRAKRAKGLWQLDELSCHRMNLCILHEWECPWQVINNFT